MSTRRERANRWWMRCPKCGEWKARHCVGAGRGFGGTLWTCQPLRDGGTVEVGGVTMTLHDPTQ